jgi:hypothetical protein
VIRLAKHIDLIIGGEFSKPHGGDGLSTLRVAELAKEVSGGLALIPAFWVLSPNAADTNSSSCALA